MKPITNIIAAAVYILFQNGDLSAQALDRYTFQSFHMGTQFTIILYADDKNFADEASSKAFGRIEELNQIMSDYIPESELNRLAASSGSGKKVKVSDDLFTVLKEAKHISEKTDGVFDVTIGPFTRLWRAVRREPEPRLPKTEEMRELAERVGYQYIILDETTRYAELTKPGMQLDFGGIAKGYASDEALRVLREMGIHSALVDAGGDITTGHPPPGRESWDVAVPKQRSGSETGHIMLSLSGKSVTTSGDMFQFIEIDGKRYSHILNPQTGLGATDQQQATVISDNGMISDAYSSALTLMEPQAGIALINSMENIEAIIMKWGENGFQEWKSDGFDDYLK